MWGEYLYSNEQKTRFLAILSEWQAELFRTSSQFEKILDKLCSNEEKAVCVEIAKRSGVSFDQKKELGTFIENAQKEISHLAVFTLTLGFVPDVYLTSRLATWIKKEAGKTCILNIKQDNQILGGAVLEYQGKRGNFSVRIDGNL